MTTVFRCDHCGKIMTREETYEVSSVNGFKKIAEIDLCEDCHADLFVNKIPHPKEAHSDASYR